ncbi:MAG: flagellar filament capping protein FliD [Gammaproteobacteria bacterium]|nr:flagellar filament capping protein FliD [Gammaproteobacteria bacterium]
MAVGFAGISTGADWSSMISQLVQLESRSLFRLQSRESELDRQISDYGLVKSAIDTFSSKVDDLRDASTLKLLSGTSSDEDVLTVNAGSSAVASTYDVEITRMASYDKLASSAYTDSDTAVGTGTLSITVNGESLDVTVDGSNNTLAGLRDAINSAAGNPGVTASILHESGGSRLILTGSETGAENAINISVVDDDSNNTDANGLSKLFYIGVGDDGLAEQITTALDAQLTVDGFDIESASNSVTGVIEGVTLELEALGSSTIAIEQDVSQVEEKVDEFVSVYNTLLDQLDTFYAGSLANDGTLRRIEQGFTDILNSPASVNGVDAYLFEAGVTRDRYGRVELDSSALSDTLASDFDKISQLFSDDATGYATRLYAYAEQVMDDIIVSREDGMSSQKRLLQGQIDRQELHIETYEKSLVAQFMSLDTTMASLMGTSNYLAGQLGY